MKGIKEKEVIAKYKDIRKVLYPLNGGGDVIGQETDADNRLVYVIRDGENIRLSYAEDENPVPVIYPTKPHIVRLTTSG